MLKDEDEHLKFVFFTGVSKFAKISVFSDLNQLRDISLSEEFAGVCGITETELAEKFQPEIESLAKAQNLTEDECLARMKTMYDGYHFSPNARGVYNPFSLLSAFPDKNFGSYWFSTGTPTFLINKLMSSDFSPKQLVDGVDAAEASLMDYRADDPDPIPLFYQTGYLTTESLDAEFRIYALRFPNDEVKYGFLHSLVPSVLGQREAQHRELGNRLSATGKM